MYTDRSFARHSQTKKNERYCASDRFREKEESEGEKIFVFLRISYTYILRERENILFLVVTSNTLGTEQGIAHDCE